MTANNCPASRSSYSAGGSKHPANRSKGSGWPQQTIGGVPTNYAVDINSALPQVLQGGTNSYIYGLGNLAQVNGSTTDYFLTDALGSTRQLVNAADQLTLAENYDPFGNAIGSMGSDSSIFDYAGQQTDQTGLQYLRARYYDPSSGRFLSYDTGALKVR